MGKEVWQILAEDVFTMSTVGLSPAAMGVRLAKNNLDNVPARQYNSPDGRTSGISRPVTFYYKS